MYKVKNFYDRIDEIAPFKSAYNWDNCGLLIGSMENEVHKVLFSLDVTENVVEYAVKEKIDLIISHHPVIFQPQKSISQKKLLTLIENKISVISAHTNLDVSKYGVNFVLAETLGLQDIMALSMSSDIAQYQISVYTPFEHLDNVMSAMHKAGAGIIGNYSHCATYFETCGQYTPLENSKPFQGTQGQLEKTKEMKLEVVCEEIYLSSVLKVMFEAHPYETPAYTVIPLKQSSPNYGLGCHGVLSETMQIKSFSIYVKERLKAPFVKLWLAGQKDDFKVKKVALCGGSGNSIIHDAKQKADVFVSSDFTYHQLLDAPLPVIDAGHFYTENLMMPRLRELFSDFECEMIMKEDFNLEIL